MVCSRNIFRQTKPKGMLEEIEISKYYAILTSPKQFILDWGLGLVVFDTDCLKDKKPYLIIILHIPFLL
jgi:hypothetical protein